MLRYYSVNGYKTFNEEAKISFNANKAIKNKDNVFENNILKSAIIYGPNNTGKSSFVESLFILKNMVLDGKINEDFIKYDFDYNFFDENKIISFNIEFEEEQEIYNYLLDIQFEKGIKEEKLLVNNKEIFNRNKNSNIEDIDNIRNILKDYNDKLLVTLLPNEYKKYTDGVINFFDKMIIFSKRFMDFEKIVDDINSLNKEQKQLFNQIIKEADISIEKIEYNERYSNKNFNLTSYYKMSGKEKQMISVLSDSDGTQWFMRYILKIIKMKKKGGILVIDEIDRSLHTLLTKSLICIFNSEDNNNLQLLSTSHDLLLLDCQNLFRKDQIWFTYKDDKKIYFYTLNDFKANKDEYIRNKTMIGYLKNMFGALPHPNIEEIFYE